MVKRLWLMKVLVVATLALGLWALVLPWQRPASAPLSTLPSVPVPAHNSMSDEKIALGRMLFFDARLSGDGSTSCATCHLPQHGWCRSDALAPGYPGHHLWRNNPTVLNAAYLKKLMWDGTLDSLEIQARSAMQAPVEGNGNALMVQMRLRLIPEYVVRFGRVFGSEWPLMDDAWRAIAAFERTLVSDSSQVPFDRYLAGDQSALTVAARRGLVLFEGKAGCIQCHYGALATDEGFHALGLPRQPLFDSNPRVQVNVRWQNRQRDVPSAVYRNMDEDLGRYYRTRDPVDIGKFRTPSLRELKYTAPYMHNGVFATLREVVDFFNAGGGAIPSKSPLLKPLGLSNEEKSDLVAFLEALSMERPLTLSAPSLPPIVPLDGVIDTDYKVPGIDPAAKGNP